MKLESKSWLLFALVLLFSACDSKIDDNLISNGTNMSKEQQEIQQNLDTKTYEEIKDVVKDNQQIALDEKTVIIFGRNGCIYCDELKKDIQNNLELKEMLKNNFRLYYINTSYFKMHSIGNKNKTKEVSTQDIARTLNINLTPTIMFFNEDGNIKYIYPGYTNKFQDLLIEVKNTTSQDEKYKLINDSLSTLIG